MTAADKRDDDRLAGADPRWRARRTLIQRGRAVADAIGSAAVLILGDDLAVAVAWDPIRRPIPIRSASGRGPRAAQLLALARRHHIAVHRDPALAAALAAPRGAPGAALDTVDSPIPEPHWPRLAEIIAAVRGRSPDRSLVALPHG